MGGKLHLVLLRGDAVEERYDKRSRGADGVVGSRLKRSPVLLWQRLE